MKLGRVHKHDEAPLKFATYMSPTLPLPPPSADWSMANYVADLGMMGNDQVGNCTAADIAHAVMFNTANTDGEVVPTADEVIKFYSSYSGYVPGQPNTDNGASLSEAADAAVKTGLCGQKLSAYLDVDETNLEQVKQAIYLFGGCAVGVQLPQSAYDGFGKGIWGDVTDTNIVGGHDMFAVAYDDKTITFVTWGALQQATWAWFSKYCDEAQARLYFDWIAASVGTSIDGFSLEQLKTDLGMIK